MLSIHRQFASAQASARNYPKGPAKKTVGKPWDKMGKKPMVESVFYPKQL
jgi:hypothetical protein